MRPARVATGALSLSPGTYSFYVNLAGLGLFGQKLVGRAGSVTYYDAHLEVRGGIGLEGLAFNPGGMPGTGAFHANETPDVSARYSLPGPYLAVENFTAGSFAEFQVSSADPGDIALLAISLSGGGPTVGRWGVFYLDWPIILVPAFPILVDGTGRLPVYVPPFASGARVWFHGMMAGSKELTNDLCLEVK